MKNFLKELSAALEKESGIAGVSALRGIIIFIKLLKKYIKKKDEKNID
ncbi:MAG: hypothetical protein HF978_21980 [Desulfobacteraceae bacterium]|nr:hypothetical protein [Desulfobacteraceae bacterium]MBC2758212.1 hypothetical protein [Desulfobacteraceae bacterium]